MENLDYIDNYFKGQLTAEEIRQFELRIEQDPGFAQDVAFYVSASGMLKEQAVAETMERFRELEEVQPVQMKQSPVRRLVYWVAAAAVSIGVIIRMFFLNPASVTRFADNYISNELTIFTISTMGPSLDDSIGIAKKYFETKKYSEALRVYEGLVFSYPEKNEMILNAGIVSLKADDVENAIHYFESYEKADLFANEGKFYHALAVIKRNNSGDQVKAKQMLEDVVKNKYTHHETAAKWLKEM